MVKEEQQHIFDIRLQGKENQAMDLTSKSHRSSNVEAVTHHKEDPSWRPW
jgi:hypothetical protein